MAKKEYKFAIRYNEAVKYLIESKQVMFCHDTSSIKIFKDEFMGLQLEFPCLYCSCQINVDHLGQINTIFLKAPQINRKMLNMKYEMHSTVKLNLYTFCFLYYLSRFV